MDAVQFAQDLIRFNSVSSRSNEPISRFVSDHLEKQGFETEWLTYLDDQGQTKVNLVAKREGRSIGLPDPLASTNRTSQIIAGGIAFLAHTDVVPADDWNAEVCGPFEPTVHNQRLWGRGSCDMKGSLACALAAIERISVEHQQAPIYLVCTADEELGTVGARQVDRESNLFQEMVERRTVGIVGEPTLLKIVHAHKGGIGLQLTSRGRSAHSSTRLGLNANHRLIPMLSTLLEIHAQCENDPTLHNARFDPPTLSWNIVVRNEPLAVNITPSLAQASVFFRPMPLVDHEPLIERVRLEALRLGIEFGLFDKTPPLDVPAHSSFVRQMMELAGCEEPLTVCYATDGGVLRRLEQMVVCGPGSIDQAHRSDEFITLEQLNDGTNLFETAFRKWACFA